MQLQERNTQASQATPPQAVMMQMANGHRLTQLIYIVAKLGIPDLLKDGPKSCAEIASATETNPKSVYRVMRTLASVGIFAGNQDCFKLTPLAACLQSNVPGSMRSMVIMTGEEQYKAWGNSLYSMKTGASAFEDLYGASMFQY